MKINVLSLFGGIECGRVAMDRVWFDVRHYFSAEVDKYPIQVVKNKYPEIIHIGSVTDVYFKESTGGLYWGQGDGQTIWNIDLLIGGSPCQDLSIAKWWGKGLEGEKSGLFYEYVRILNETKPAYFLLENVASMRKEDKDKITEIIGVEPIMINSNLVSAQNRKRLYWVGRWNGEKYETVKIEQPKDKEIILADILEDIPLNNQEWKELPNRFIEIVVEMIQRWKILLWQFRRKNLRVHADQEKVCTLTSNMWTGGNNVPIIISEKAYPITATYTGACPRDYLERSQRQLVLSKNEENIYMWRKLTPVECERLQTLPDNYTDCISNSRRYKAIGNGWTVDVIAYIFRHFNF